MIDSYLVTSLRFALSRADGLVVQLDTQPCGVAGVACMTYVVGPVDATRPFPLMSSSEAAAAVVAVR